MCVVFFNDFLKKLGPWCSWLFAHLGFEFCADGLVSPCISSVALLALRERHGFKHALNFGESFEFVSNKAYF